MATPTLVRHTLPGALGEILVDVRAGGRDSPRPAIVVMHGFKGFKDWGMFPPLCERLARAGFTAVSFNASGSGVDDSGEFVWPERFGHNTFSAELGDLARVIDALANGGPGTAPPSRIGLVGHSRGGGMAILQTARDPRIGALVTWAALSSVARWSDAERAQWRERGRLDVVNARTGQVLPLYTGVLDDIERNASAALDIPGAAGRIAVPWLLVHGTADTSVAIGEAERLERAAAATGRLRALYVDGAGHTFGAAHPWRGSTPELDLVFRETVAWLGKCLL
ncbi:MAG TPA: alpha/beta fold hydrolase [Gemmatimonadales bacterium]|nr:alpha/beta fold hydrolase [Gemmatimonadales bacterium]